MVTEKEKITSNTNYEISKKIYDLFKKHKDFNQYSINVNLNNQPNKYNSEDIFKNKKPKLIENETALIEVKKDNWFISFLKRIFHIKH